MKELIAQKLIRNGVKNLKEFGYPLVDEKNILTDEVYSEFFISMLHSNRGVRTDIDEAIDYVLSQIKR